MSARTQYATYRSSLARNLRFFFIFYTWVWKILGVVGFTAVATLADGKSSLREWLTCYVLIYSGVFVCQVVELARKKLTSYELALFAQRFEGKNGKNNHLRNRENAASHK